MATKTNLADHSARPHALLSASSAERWIECPPSAVAATKYPSQDTVFTREGTIAHEVAEAVASGRTVVAEGDITTEMISHGEEYRDYIESIKKTDDVVVAFETKVDYSDVAPGGFGTCDCIVIQGNTMSIVDYKYGKGVEVSAVGNPQMRLYAYGALKEYEFIYEDIKTIETHIFQPRIGNISMETFGVNELKEWVDEVVKPAAELASTGKGKYHSGSHCRFCPHAGKCRELAKECSEKVKLENGKTANIEQLAPWEIADIIANIKTVQNWLKKVEETALNDLMEGKEIPGYKVVEGRVGNRTYTNEIEVYDHLISLGMADEDITKKVLLTPADLDKVLGKKEAAKALEGYITRSPGKPTLAPVTDKRPAYDRKAELIKEFEEA